jgi:hypothetical protein
MPTAMGCCFSARSIACTVSTPRRGGISQKPSMVTPGVARGASSLSAPSAAAHTPPVVGYSSTLSKPCGCVWIQAYAVAIFPVLHPESSSSHDSR